MVRSRSLPPLLLLVSLCVAVGCAAQQPGETNAAASRYTSEEWLVVAPHLPDPKTARPDELQMAGDVLRARRFPDEAIQYYRYAIDRGGDQVGLLNRIGVTELDRGQPTAARLYFKQVTVLKKKYAEAWNNLGATETMAGNYSAAIADYQRAIKLNKKNALFHANLGSAYFSQRDYESGRHEYDSAVKLDHNIFRQGGSGGTLIHVLNNADRGRFAFEMARIAAAQADEEEMLHWLAVSAEAGYALSDSINGAKEFVPYLKDERLKLILRNMKAMHVRQVASTGPVPELPATAPAKAND
jgi:tetratricopeptide (TPR) repeat protein